MQVYSTSRVLRYTLSMPYAIWGGYTRMAHELCHYTGWYTTHTCTPSPRLWQCLCTLWKLKGGKPRLQHYEMKRHNLWLKRLAKKVILTTSLVAGVRGVFRTSTMEYEEFQDGLANIWKFLDLWDNLEYLWNVEWRGKATHTLEELSTVKAILEQDSHKHVWDSISTSVFFPH